MGWIRSKFNNLSLKKSFIIIVFIIQLLAISLSAAAIWWCTSIQQNTMQSRAIVIQNYNVLDKTSNSIQIRPEDYKYTNLTPEQSVINTIATIGTIVLPVLFVSIGIYCSSLLFYRMKLKQPINILNQGVSKIADNDLDFSISYRKNDEMGQLCSAFETMRKELYQNNKTMWQMLNERKQLNASMNHDLRTPITVVKGYTRYLQKNIPKGKISSDKLQETLGNIMDSVERLEKYVDSVRNIQAIEQIELHPEPISLNRFIEEIKITMSVLAAQLGKELVFAYDVEETEIKIDKQILFRILENIVTNSMRFAKQVVNASCSLGKDNLCFNISDDGEGFSSNALKYACRPFYTGDQDTSHLGMGLAICKTLCEKHGGELILANQEGSGAKVSFSVSIK